MIVVREHEVGVAVAVHDRAHRRGVAGDRQHAAKASGVGSVTRAAGFHGQAARAGQAQQGVGVEDAGGVERHQFTEAVAGRGGGTHAQSIEQRELREAGGGQGGLRRAGGAQPRLLGVQRLGLEGRAREHDVAEVIGAVHDRQRGHGALPRLERIGEGDGEIAAHPDVLTALAGEQERHRVGAGGRATPHDAVRGAGVGVRALQQVRGLGADRGQLRELRHDDRDADGRIVREAGLRLARERRELRGGAEPCRQRGDLRPQRGRVAAREQQQPHRRGVQARRRRRPRYSSSVTWKLLPPKPKLLTDARRG